LKAGQGGDGRSVRRTRVAAAQAARCPARWPRATIGVSGSGAFVSQIRRIRCGTPSSGG